MIDYNVPHGKKLRGMCTYESFAILSNNEASIEYINKAKALGWCIELVKNKKFEFFSIARLFFGFLQILKEGIEVG